MDLTADLKRAAVRFLRTGRLAEAQADQISAACDQIVREATYQDSRRAVRLGHQFVQQARAQGNDMLLAALRACGWALLVAGDYAASEAHYVEARNLAHADALTRSRIDRILVDVYMYLDRAPEATACASRAIAVFRRHGLASDVAKTEVNLANVYHRQDRHQKAGVLYRRAALHFAQHGPATAAALCYYNLANTRVQLFDFEEAGELYTRGRDIFEQHGDRLHATGCLYGLAWLHMLQGDFHVALRELTECEAIYREGQHARELLLCLLDRAETYLALGLYVDARQLAREAMRRAAALKLHYEQAKAMLFVGRADVGLGRRAAGQTLLKRAAAAFSALGNDGFEAASTLSLAQASRPGSARRKLLDSARRRFARAELPLWEALCDLQSLQESPGQRQVYRRLERNRAVTTVPHLYVSWQTWKGDRAARGGRPKTAHRHWARAATVLDSVRSKLPPAEVRSAFLRREADPFGRLIGAHLPLDAGMASAWVERRGHGGRWTATDDLAATHPDRARIEDSLSALAGQIAACSGLVQTTGHRSLGPKVISRSQRHLQARLRRVLAEIEAPSAPATTEDLLHQFATESQRQPIVQFYLNGPDLVVFVHQGGSCRHHVFVDGAAWLDELLGVWRFLVECTAYSRGSAPADTRHDEQEILSRISRWLLPPLELPRDCERLVIIPDGGLSCLPWLALETDGAPLAEHTDLTLVPSLRHLTAARLVKGDHDRLRLFVGARTGLPHIDTELRAIKSRFESGRLDVFDPCRRADWPDQEDGGLWHFLGHATLRADNPFYSALELSDGPLLAADLRLKRNHVRLVTLAACRTAPHASLPGDESIGLVRALLEMGSGSVVASHWAVADASTAAWMEHFYDYLLGGATVSRAVRKAALAVREEYPLVFHWGAFSSFGTGT